MKMTRKEAIRILLKHVQDRLDELDSINALDETYEEEVAAIAYFKKHPLI